MRTEMKLGNLCLWPPSGHLVITADRRLRKTFRKDLRHPAPWQAFDADSFNPGMQVTGSAAEPPLQQTNPPRRFTPGYLHSFLS